MDDSHCTLPRADTQARGLDAITRAIIDRALARLLSELGRDLVGLLATGSRVRGEGDANSDIDLDAVVAFSSRQRRTWRIDGVDVEIILNPEAQIRRLLERDHKNARGVYQHMWGTGIVFYDPQGVAGKLKEQAERQLRRGPPPIPAAELWRFRSGPRGALLDIADVIDADPEAATYAIGAHLVQILESHCRVQGRYRGIKPKRALRELASWDPVGAHLMRAACSGTPRERLAALGRFVDHYLAPIGGALPEEWESAWAPVKEAS